MKEKLKLEAQVTKVESENAPELRALASVQFGGFKLNNIKVVEREFVKNGNIGTRNIVLFPQHKGLNREGKVEYKDIVTFGKNNDEQGRMIKYVISNMILNGLEGEEKTSRITEETDFEIDKDLIGAYISPTTNSEKILGVGTIYYGGLISIKPVFLKEVINSETNEKFNVINFETRQNKEGKYNEVVYPNQEGLRNKCVNVSLESLNKNRKQIKEYSVLDEYIGDGKGEETLTKDEDVEI